VLRVSFKDELNKQERHSFQYHCFSHLLTGPTSQVNVFTHNPTLSCLLPHVSQHCTSFSHHNSVHSAQSHKWVPPLSQLYLHIGPQMAMLCRNPSLSESTRADREAIHGHVHTRELLARAWVVVGLWSCPLFHTPDLHQNWSHANFDVSLNLLDIT
jgi:hypothetical protein